MTKNPDFRSGTIIIVGILSGIFTATEAGAVAAVYSLVIAYLYGYLNKKVLFEVFSETITTSGVALFL
ncbi:MAG: TRAP transporter large permease subunit, partial [Desulfosalsimonas sp.]